MYLLAKSETLQSGVTVTFTNGADIGNIIDGDRTTSAETADRDPNLTIDLGTRKVIDALWLEGANLKDYDLKASNNNINFNDIETDITVTDGRHSFLTFTNTQAYRYWRLAFSQRRRSDPNYRIYEVFLMRLLLDLNTAADRPYRCTPSKPRTGVVAYETYNGRVVQYNSGEREKTVLTFEWQNLSEAMANSLESLWKGPPYAPELTVYPRPDVEASEIFRAKWDREFGFEFAGAYHGFGKRGRCVFREV